MRQRKGRLLSAAVVCLLCVGGLSLTAEGADYVPPAGIPAPSFGINESHMMYVGQTYDFGSGPVPYPDAGSGPYTHYIDNTHPNATNSSNPYGTADRPRLDIYDGLSKTLPAGSVVEVHGGPYAYQGWRKIICQGTAARPVFVRSIDPNNKVRTQAVTGQDHDLRIEGSYLIFENQEYYDAAIIRIWDFSHHIAIRNCEVHNPLDKWISKGAVVYAQTYCSDIVWYQNHIHHNRRGSEATPQDCHGVAMESGSYNMWVLENHIHDNSGDAFQASHLAIPAPHHVYVGGNLFHDDRENGVDLKSIHDVVVSQNVIYGYQPSATSSGDAVVVGSNGLTPGQYGPIRSWILFNDIRDSQTGLRVEGAADCWILGNTFHDIDGDAIQFDIDPDSDNINVIANTITSVGGDGIHHHWQTGATNLSIASNIISDVGDAHIEVSRTMTGAFTVSNNMFYQTGGLIFADWGDDERHTNSESVLNSLSNWSGNVVGDPLFVDAATGNYRIAGGSAAIDVALETTAYQSFYGLYGVEIRVDKDGTARPQGAGWDAGAYEYVQAAAVAGRHVFYNSSAFDGNDPAANAADDAAIATDKTALLPGGTATFGNYTSYWRGINGVMVDIDSPGGTPTAADFEFRVGNDNDPGGWPAAPAPSGVTVRPGEGQGGSDRVTIIWTDNAIAKQWLQVTVKATANTGLAAADVFYFGSAIAETGNSPADARVGPTDAIGVRNNPHTLGVNPAAIDDAYDFNRDGKVGPADQVICRNNGASSLTALKLITVP